MVRLLVVCSLMAVSCNDTPLRSLLEREPLVSKIEVRPEALNFGAPLPGEVVERTFTVTSVGTGPANVGAQVDRSLGFDFDGAPSVLGVGESREFVVSYTSSGLSRDTFASVLHDTGERGLGVTLTVDEALGLLSVTPSPIDFGAVGFGRHVTQPATLENVGSAPLIVREIRVDGDTFSLDSSPEVPLTLEPGETQQVMLGFDPIMQSGAEQGLLWTTVQTGRVQNAGPVPLNGVSVLGGLRGRVCDPKNTGWVPGATVRALIDTNGDRVPDAERTTVSDKDGYYVIEDLPRSTVSVEITKGRLAVGYQTDVTGGGVLELPDPTCLNQGDLTIAVVPGGYDDTGSLLDGIGLEYTVEDASLLADSSRLDRYDIVLAGCAAASGAVDAEVLEDFVRDGGGLYVSDLSVIGVSDMFSDAWSQASGGAYTTAPLFPLDSAMVTRVGSKITIAYEAVIGLSIDGGDPSVTATTLAEVNLGTGQEAAIVR
ncbi:MAG: choice-of-anchor D domain-containing protein, partial [Myxococcota bacterium]